MHGATGILSIPKHLGRMLDFGAAPGGFMEVALRINPDLTALGYTLPRVDGGWKVMLPDSRRGRAEVKELDITMLAKDLGMPHTPADHPDAKNFLPREFEAGSRFDLVICGGAVRPSPERASYREAREDARLRAAQLVLGLEHINQGGSMIVLLHRVTGPGNVRLLHDFSKFSKVQIFKSTKGHNKKSAFYMTATGVEPNDPVALDLVMRWKKLWETATFGTDNDFDSARSTDEAAIDAALEQYGSTLIEMGKKAWRIQAYGIRNAPFMKR